MEEKKSIKGIKLEDNTSDSGSPWAAEQQRLRKTGREIVPRAHPVCTAFPSGKFLAIELLILD